jgi:hypothetical protein
MSDALENSPSFGGNPGEPVAEVDPDDLKTLWQEISNLQATDPGQHVAIGFEAKVLAKPGVNAEAVWYRSMMIRLLNEFKHEQLAPWISIEWIGSTEREGLPFDVEEFFRRLSEGGVQNG